MSSKISLLPAAAALTGPEIIPGVQAGGNVGITADQVGDRTKSRFGVQKNNATAADPTVGNDSSQGYGAGSEWINTTTGVIWYCRSAGVGAAVWTPQAVRRHPGYIAGRSILPNAGLTAAAGSGIPAGSGRFVPWVPEEDCTIDALSVRITTVGTTNFQLAVYASDSATLKPTGLPLGVTSNAANTVATTLTVSLTANVSLKAGQLYWLAICQNDSAAIYISHSGINWTSWLCGSTTPVSFLVTSGNQQVAGYTTPLTFGVWPDVTAAVWTELNATNSGAISPRIFSVP